MPINRECYRGTAERELARWGVAPTEANIGREIERIVERLSCASGNDGDRLASRSATTQAAH